MKVHRSQALSVPPYRMQPHQDSAIFVRQHYIMTSGSYPRALSLFKLGTVAVDALRLRIAGHAGDDRASTLHRPEEVAADG